MRRAFSPGEERAARAGHGRDSGRCPQHRGRCRSGQVSAGPRHPIGRRRARHRRGGGHAARRFLPDDPGGPGCVLRRGDRGAAPARRAAAGAGDDHLRRQERLSGGSCAGARAGRRHLYRTRAAYPAQIGFGVRRSAAALPAMASPRRSSRPARRSSTRPTTRATCTRPLPPISESSATPSSCSAN